MDFPDLAASMINLSLSKIFSPPRTDTSSIEGFFPNQILQRHHAHRTDLAKPIVADTAQPTRPAMDQKEGRRMKADQWLIDMVRRSLENLSKNPAVRGGPYYLEDDTLGNRF